MNPTHINHQSAIALVRERLDQVARKTGGQFEILHGSTKEIEKGWIFFMRDAASAAAVDSPLLVTREGAIYELPGAIPWERALQSLPTTSGL